MSTVQTVLGLDELARLPRQHRAIAIGNFDGVHRGHQQLLTALVEPALARQAVRCALTFHPHPSSVVAPDRVPVPLVTLDERIRLLHQNGAEEVVVLRFDEAFSRFSAEEFVRRVLVDGMSACHVAVGANFRFAFQQQGNPMVLSSLGQQFGFGVTSVPLLAERGLPLSSSQIRNLVQTGEVTRAARLLGRPYLIAGPVVKGRGVGSKQTVPTLNVAPPYKVLPADGVYVTRVHHTGSGAVLPGITNIGLRPTFDDGHTERSIESFVLGPLGEPPTTIRLEFLARLREERRFENPEALKAQILKDVSRAQSFHRRASLWSPSALRAG
ncbi:MAG: riboflavin biosynthesis protein RibF [Bryobacterales bacterium]|nr:riboflavin biosynthesis protein RibF [Bryobacterales bacterium]